MIGKERDAKSGRYPQPEIISMGSDRQAKRDGNDKDPGAETEIGHAPHPVVRHPLCAAIHGLVN